MNGAIRRAARLGTLVVACAGVAGVGGCGKSEPASTPTQQPDVTIHTYTVRGVVESLPGETTDLTVHHEAIPDFVRQDGTLGMDTMTMAFWPPAGIPLDQARVKNLDLSGIKVGDKVSMTFEVVQDAATGAMKGYYATKVVKLPADTELDFSHLPPRQPPNDEGEGTEPSPSD